MSSTESANLPSGYNREGKFFYELNRHLIDRKRRELDRQRAERESLQRQALHWMKCPKCGGLLEEIDVGGVKVDKCRGCEGVFLDRGELDLLQATRGRLNFMQSLARFFRIGSAAQL